MKKLLLSAALLTMSIISYSQVDGEFSLPHTTSIEKLSQFVGQRVKVPSNYGGDIHDRVRFESCDFYAKEDNSIEMSGNNILPADNKPPFFKNVMIIEWRIRALPIKISLPLCDSISVFDGETHSNKDYRAIYGNDEDYFRIGYLDGKLFTELQLKKRQHKRFVSANLELNTIIPEGIDMRFDKDFDYIAHNLLGEFDLSALGI